MNGSIYHIIYSDVQLINTINKLYNKYFCNVIRIICLYRSKCNNYIVIIVTCFLLIDLLLENVKYVIVKLKLINVIIVIRFLINHKNN